MTAPRNDHKTRQDHYSLFHTEERVLEEINDLLNKLSEFSQGVHKLADAYRHTYDEQKRLLRVSDRMHSDLQRANRELKRQAEEHAKLNQALETEAHKRAQLAEELHHLATVDELTGTASRRQFFERGGQELKRFARNANPLSVLMLDLDHFKQVNDRYGHAAGDRVLTRFAELCGEMLRDVDVFGRLGGEEFAVMLPDTELPAAHTLADRLQYKLERATIDETIGDLELTVSIGGAAFRQDDSLDNALKRADDALYEAKRRGRNCVVT